MCARNLESASEKWWRPFFPYRVSFSAASRIGESLEGAVFKKKNSNMYKHECWIKKLAGQKWCRAFAQPHNWGSEKKKNILRVALNYKHKTYIQVPIKQNYSSEEKKMRRTRDRFGRQQMGGVFFIKSPEWTISARKPVAIPLVFSFFL